MNVGQIFECLLLLMREQEALRKLVFSKLKYVEVTNMCSRVLCIEYFSLHGNKAIWKGVGNFCKREPCLRRGDACSCRLWCSNPRKVNGLFGKKIQKQFLLFKCRKLFSNNMDFYSTTNTLSKTITTSFF
jgi:hypothetical protein